VSGDIFSKKRNVAANDPTFAATWCDWRDFFAAVDIGLSCLRSALRIPPCRKAASLQNDALCRFAGARSNPL